MATKSPRRNIALMTAEICAVQPSSGALYSRTGAPRPRCMPALTASHPSRAEQVTSKAQEHHPGIPIANYGKLCSLPVVRHRHPHHPRARGTPARSTCHRRRAPRRPQRRQPQLIVWTRVCGRRKTTACSAALLPDGWPGHLADASSKLFRQRN